MVLEKLPVFFISHGGGPWPYIPQMKKDFEKTAQWLSGIPKTLKQKPQAILSISGHWEEKEFAVSAAEKPAMIYDYTGFPEVTYHIKYPASGSSQLATRIQDLLFQHKMSCQEDKNHGLDHGTFVPLVMMYPDAEIPVVSMSLKSTYNAAEHIQMGQALQVLREEGVLILGSGSSFHNMKKFFTPAAAPISFEFGHWLQQTVTEKNFQLRNQKLIEWEKAPAAREAHPHEDHLLPLMVVAGAAGEDLGETIFIDQVYRIEMASFKFGK